MKKNFCLLVFFFCFFASTGQNDTLHGKSGVELPLRGLCAHRGAMETHPENTIVAFKAAVEAGAQMVELDIWLTKDRQMVVVHDASVDRTTNGSGRVSGLTLAQVKKLDAGSWKSRDFAGQQIPTFEEVLSVIPRNVWINVHIKEESGTSQMAAQLLQKENRLHQSFLACSRKAAIKARQVVPGIMICNMDRQDSISDYVKETIIMGVDFIQLKGDVTPEFAGYCRQLKAKGIRINYFGTDSPETIRLLFSYGVDFPLVNDIVHSINYLKE
uniref:glycerophosphodiester phosphodiesterase n=1 Tax=uncultured Draconibacterium sp. TaxID=1573823 RepID=UPI00321657B4